MRTDVQPAIAELIESQPRWHALTKLEAYGELLELAERRFSRTSSIPTELLALQALTLALNDGWTVQRAASDAIARRWASARRDDLKVARRPARGAPFGNYETRRAGRRVRPYLTQLDGLLASRGHALPISASCDCPDFLRSSLGLCKHVLIVLNDVAERPRCWRQAMQSSELPLEQSRLEWDPVRPLAEIPGDWLTRLILRDPAPRPGHRRPGAVDAARKFMGRRDSLGVYRLRQSALTNPRTRRDAIECLLRLQNTLRGAAAEARQPAVAALLRREQAHLDERARLHAAAPDRKKALRTLRRALFPYQREGVTRFFATGRLLLADDMGLGKTAQAIAACHALFQTGDVRRGLLVVPASLKGQWSREWNRFTDRTPLEIVEGRPEDRADLYERTRRGFLVANYEQLLRDDALIRRWNPEIIVLDEAQRIKNWATRTAQIVKSFEPRYRLVLTGTPMENRIDELASILEWVDDMAMEPKWRLEPGHATPSDQGAGHRVRRLHVIRERIAPHLLRRVRHDVLAQLPERMDAVRPVPMTEPQLFEHNALLPNILALTGIAKKRPLRREEFERLMMLLTMQRMIANGLALAQYNERWPELESVRIPSEPLLASLDSPKLLEFREIMRQLVVEQDRKVVVFSQWRRMVRLAEWATRGVLSEVGGRTAFFTGAVRLRARERNIIEFHDDPALRVLFLTDAGGVGLNLQRAATACVNLDLPWNPAVLEQRIGRVHRLGQTDPVDVYNLVSQDSIESRIESVLDEKRSVFAGLFDGASDEVAAPELPKFIDRVAALVEPATPDPMTAPESDGEDDDTLARMLDAAEDDDREDEDRVHENAAHTVTHAETSIIETKPAHSPGPATPASSLLEQLDVRTNHDGSVSITAPPEAAPALATLFRHLAEQLDGTAPRADGQRH